MSDFEQLYPIPEKYFSSLSAASKRHLVRSLANLEKGSPTTPGFKLYGASDWSVVDRFLASVKSLANVPGWLLDYEYSRKEKFGPQGGHAPWSELRENATLYFTRPTAVKDKSCNVAHYDSLNLQMLSAPIALRTLKGDGKIATRAAGWDKFELKKTNPYAQAHALYVISSGRWRNGYGYFFSRYNKLKNRLFVPMPFSSMIMQAQYYNVFLKAIQNSLRADGSNSPFLFWADKIGFDFCFKTAVQNKIRNYPLKNLVFVMRDFEKMDTTMGPSQKAAYFIPKLAAAFNYSSDSQAYKIMEEIMLFSNRCPIATPDGMWVGDHGEASGATVTNGGETCANQEYDRIFQAKLFELASQAKIEYARLISVGNGDDGMTIHYLKNVDEFDAFAKLIREAADYAASVTGFIIQSDKWDIHLGTYGKYCQYLISVTEDGEVRAYYPAALILNSIMNPEKQYTKDEWDKDYRDLDIISKLDNGRDLPYFHQLIDFVDSGMKYHLLGDTDSSAKRILSKYDRYLSLQSGSREFNKWDDQGILSSPTVKYLLEKKFSGLRI